MSGWHGWLQRAGLPVVVLMIAVGVLCTGCEEFEKIEKFDFSQDSPDVSESEQLQSEFYTCGEYDKKKKEFKDLRDVFGPDDDILVAVAELAEDERKTRLIVEVVSPDNEPLRHEYRKYRSGSIVAIKFSVPKLTRDGGYGQWRINFYSDTVPLGYADFYILRNPEEGIPQEVELEDEELGTSGRYILK